MPSTTLSKKHPVASASRKAQGSPKSSKSPVCSGVKKKALFGGFGHFWLIFPFTLRGFWWFVVNYRYFWPIATSPLHVSPAGVWKQRRRSWRSRRSLWTASWIQKAPTHRMNSSHTSWSVGSLWLRTDGASAQDSEALGVCGLGEWGSCIFGVFEWQRSVRWYRCFIRIQDVVLCFNGAFDGLVARDFQFLRAFGVLVVLDSSVMEAEVLRNIAGVRLRCGLLWAPGNHLFSFASKTACSLIESPDLQTKSFKG